MIGGEVKVGSGIFEAAETDGVGRACHGVLRPSNAGCETKVVGNDKTRVETLRWKQKEVE